MMNFVHTAFQDADVLIYMVEVGEKKLKDEKLFEKIKNTSVPLLLLINKIDLVTQDDVAEQINIWKKDVPNAEARSVQCPAGHQFCLNCWRSSLQMQVTEGAALCLQCPGRYTHT